MKTSWKIIILENQVAKTQRKSIFCRRQIKTLRVPSGLCDSCDTFTEFSLFTEV